MRKPRLPLPKGALTGTDIIRISRLMRFGSADPFAAIEELEKHYEAYRQAYLATNRTPSLYIAQHVRETVFRLRSIATFAGL